MDCFRRATMSLEQHAVWCRGHRVFIDQHCPGGSGACRVVEVVHQNDTFVEVGDFVIRIDADGPIKGLDCFLRLVGPAVHYAQVGPYIGIIGGYGQGFFIGRDGFLRLVGIKI